MSKSITNILQTQIFEGTQLKTKTDYSGAYVYVNNVLSFTNIQGGRIVSSQTEGTSNNDVFQYNLTDHQYGPSTWYGTNDYSWFK